MTQSANTPAFYLRHIVPQVPRLLSAMDREPYSATYGECDREHWAWKFRDFPIGMLQSAAYPLALLWKMPHERNPYYQSAEIRKYALAALDASLNAQRRNGAFDSFYPNEFDHGVTLGILYGICEAMRVLDDALDPAWKQKALRAIRRAFDFSLQEDERHAFISNHWALFALTYLSGSQMLDAPQLQEKAGRVIAQILREQSEEGWFNEYGGPDPGYESLGISYLAMYWQRTQAPDVLQALRRSVEFYSYCVHPDGSAGGCYGSRATSLYFPAGFEILRSQIPLAGAVAEFMKARLDRQNALIPSAADPMNLIPLASNYLLAEVECSTPAGCPALPCEALHEVRHFSRSGITVTGNTNYYAVFGGAKGGVCRVFDKRSEKIVYEDSGYILRTGSETLSSQFWGAKSSGTDAVLNARAQFAVSAQRQATPWNYLLFRLLNLFVFPFRFLGRWLRIKMVRQLVLERRSEPYFLERAVRMQPERIEIEDELRAESPVRFEEVALARLHTAMHMGSAKYFRSSDAEPALLPETSHMAAELGSQGCAKNSFAIVWQGDSGPHMVQGNRAAEKEPVEVTAIR